MLITSNPSRFFILSICSSILQSIENVNLSSSYGKIFSLEKNLNTKYVLLENKEHAYLKSRVNFDKKIKEVKIISSFPKVPIFLYENWFNVIIAPNGICVLKITIDQ